MALHSSYSFMSKYEKVNTIPTSHHRLASSMYTCHHISVSPYQNDLRDIITFNHHHLLAIFVFIPDCYLCLVMSKVLVWSTICGAVVSLISRGEKLGLNADLFPCLPPSKLCPKLVFNFQSSALSVFSSKF